jgi:hypothetical protein
MNKIQAEKPNVRQRQSYTLNHHINHHIVNRLFTLLFMSMNILA